MLRGSIALLLLSTPMIATAATPIQSPGNLGLGIGGGTHASGLSVKFFGAEQLAFQGVVGFYGAGREYGGIGLSGDVLWEQRPLVSGDVLDLAWNLGPGVNVGIGDATWLGVGGVLGLELDFHAAPIDLVFEYRPGVLISPVVDADLIGFGAHLRVYPF